MRRAAARGLAAVLVGAAMAPAQQPVMAGSEGRVCHIRVEGDLDCATMARELNAELVRAKTEKAGLIVLELECGRSRPDVVWEMGKSVRECGVPVTVLVHNGADGRVGAGALELGILAGELFAIPRTTVRQTPSDDLRWLAPTDTNWERVERELSGAVWVDLNERGLDPGLAAAIVTPSKGCWCVRGEDGKPWTVTTTEPAKGPGSQAEQIVFSGGQGWERTELSAEVMGRLGFARTGASNLSQVLAASGRGLATRTTWTVKSGLGPARARVSGVLDEARAAAHRAGDLLDVKKRTRGRNAAASDYRGAGREALRELDRARELADEAERIVADYPELLRQAPVAGAKGPTVRRGADPVSAAIAECRKDQAKLGAKARDYAAR